jgi:5-methylcytosine-specific restriction endonuclease McrA
MRKQKRGWYKYKTLYSEVVGKGWEMQIYQIIHGDGKVGATNIRVSEPRRPQKRDKKKSYHRYYKEKAYKALGGKCVRCGFSDERGLEIDHINNDGYIDRINGKRSNYKEYQYIANNPEKAKERLQLLCANCNRIKMWEEREHAKKANKRYNYNR